MATTALGGAGRVALVTGCSSGVGLSLSVALAKHGYVSYATMRDLSKDADLKAEAAAKGVEVRIKQLDVEKEDSIHKCVQEIIAEAGRIDVLVNNAGYSIAKTVENTTLEEAQNVFDVNFFSIVKTSKAVLPHMRKQLTGHIVNLSSIGGILGMPFNDIYCAAKSAVEGLSESMATTLQHFNIKVSVVEPGAIKTKFTQRVFADLQKSKPKDDPYDEIWQKYMAKVQEKYAKATSQTGDEVAEFIVNEVLLAKEHHVRNFTSEHVKKMAKGKLVDDTADSHVNGIINDYLGGRTEHPTSK